MANHSKAPNKKQVKYAGHSIEAQYDICFVGLKCADLLNGISPARYIGGIERDLVTLAVLLAKRGTKVAFITYKNDLGECTTADGIDIYPSFDAEAGLPILRFLYPRAVCLARSVISLRAAIFIQMGGGVETGLVSLVVAMLKKDTRFIYLVASDGDCSRSLPFLRTIRERVSFRIGIRLADRVIAQTETQKNMLKNEFGVQAEVSRLPNVLPSGGGSSTTIPKSRNARPIIWVGRLDKAKRPDRFLRLATNCPQLQFEIIGESNTSTRYAENIVADAETIQNMTLRGKVTGSAMDAIYRRAAILCCTSDLEGFPAVFLEAWSCELPVITMFDPDGLVEQNQCGKVVGSVDELAKVLTDSSFEANLGTWSANAARLYADRFSPNALTDQFCDLAFEIKT